MNWGVFSIFVGNMVWDDRRNSDADPHFSVDNI